jgi:hypothetical protein
MKKPKLATLIGSCGEIAYRPIIALTKNHVIVKHSQDSYDGPLLTEEVYSLSSGLPLTLGWYHLHPTSQERLKGLSQ